MDSGQPWINNYCISGLPICQSINHYYHKPMPIENSIYKKNVIEASLPGGIPVCWKTLLMSSVSARPSSPKVLTVVSYEVGSPTDTEARSTTAEGEREGKEGG